VTGGLLLVIDTATRTGVLGLATTDGALISEAAWTSAHRHGEEMLSRLDKLLAAAPAGVSDIVAIVVGTGPGSFTGLRIGLATAKTLAYGLNLPLVGVSTAQALGLAADTGDGEVIVALPAGANDRYLVRVGVAKGAATELAPAELVVSIETVVPAGIPLVAVDLVPPEVPVDAASLGRRAVGGLAEALARLGAAALAIGRRDDVAELVPAYVALPRGIAAAAASVEWSPDLR